MQNLVDISFQLSIIGGLISVLCGAYLVNLWRKQETRIITDIPLMFGGTFMAIGLNFIVMGAMNIGLIPDTMEFFRLRTLFLISGSVIPLFVAILHIWFARFRKYFPHAVVTLSGYWTIASLFGPTEQVIMLLLIPPMICTIIAVTITFGITWKTGRLKEVRSDLLVVAAILLMISQIGKLFLGTMGLEYVADLISAVGIIIGSLGLSNPWYRRRTKTKVAEAHTPTQLA